jgi:hypothetical protein
MIYGALQVFHTLLTIPLKIPDSSINPEPHVSEFLKGGLKDFVAVEELLDDQRAAEPRRALETACTHIEVWTAGCSVIDPGPELLVPPRPPNDSHRRNPSAAMT